MNKNIDNKKGAALSMVVIFVLFCMIVGVAVLISAQANIQQGVALQVQRVIESSPS